MEQLLNEAKRLVQRLNNHGNCVDILTAETTNLENRIASMQRYKEEVNKLNNIVDHRPRTTIHQGTQLENRKIQNLVDENRELSISLAEHQSAMDLIMKKYRQQVRSIKQHNEFEISDTERPVNTNEMLFMKEKMADMAHIMWELAATDDGAKIRELEMINQLEVENENLRDLLEISGRDKHTNSSNQITYNNNERKALVLKSAKTSSEGYIKPINASIKMDAISHYSEKDDEEEGNGEKEDIQCSGYSSFRVNKPKQERELKDRNISRHNPLPFQYGGEENDYSNAVNISHKKRKHTQNGLFEGLVNSVENTTKVKVPLNKTSSDIDSKEHLPIFPLENNFNPIINDKPLDGNNAYNGNLSNSTYSSENLNNSTYYSENNSIFGDAMKSSDSDELSDISETSVIEALDYIIDMADLDNSISDSLHNKELENEESIVYDTPNNISPNEHNENDVMDYLDDIINYEISDEDEESDNASNEQTSINHKHQEDMENNNIQCETKFNIKYNNATETRLKDDIDGYKISSDERTVVSVEDEDEDDDDEDDTTLIEDIDQTLSDFDLFLDDADDFDDSK